ncbi:MAG TPA: hypothetical protein VK190_04560 [Pseudoneobacillus sp.]|nr:hypothetical protein [Pseudoneobacillus sp.]
MLSPLFKKLANGIVTETSIKKVEEIEVKYPVIRKGKIIRWEKM